jgi:hypothetical protein
MNIPEIEGMNMV